MLFPRYDKLFYQGNEQKRQLGNNLVEARNNNQASAARL